MEKIDILRRTDIFYDLTGAQMEMLASICEERVVKLGDIVFEENNQGDEMFVISRGAVEILVDPSIVGGPGAKKRGSMPVTIATLRGGQTFGEIVLVDQGLRTASARCAEAETLGADHRFLTMIGASGSGKSSLVRAGLIPALRWRLETSGWLIYMMTPTAHPLGALAEAINKYSPNRSSTQVRSKEFTSTAQGLQQNLDRLADAAGAEHAMLVIDQFEELFTLCRDEEEQHTFVENVLTAALQPGGKSLVLIVMRADFYAYCANFDLLRQAVSTYQEYIGPIPPRRAPRRRLGPKRPTP